MSDEFTSLAKFDGSARLFPLPNVVLFPHVMQPLHIFEPRYRQMTADALAGDRLIALVLLQPGWEGDYDGRPALHPIACLGRIVSEQQLHDGRYNIVLRGLNRVLIQQEIDQDRLYRMARVELLQDVAVPTGETSRELRRSLGQRVMPWFPAEGPAREQLQQLFQNDLALGTLCDILSFALPLPVEAKQLLLEEVNVESRRRALLSLLQTRKPSKDKDAGDRKFPPDFSSN